MNIEDLKQSTLNKINNNNFNFTNDEIAYLFIDISLFLIFIKKIVSDEKLFEENFEVAYVLLENVDFEGNDIATELYNYISDFEEKYYYYMLKTKTIIIDSNLLRFDEKYFNIVIETLKSRTDYNKIILNGNKVISTNKIIAELLDKKEYYVISKIIDNFEQSFTDEALFERFLNEFPFKEYNISIIRLPNYNHEKELKKVLYNNLNKLNYSNLKELYLRESDEDIKTNILGIMTDKLNNSNENLNFVNYKLNTKRNSDLISGLKKIFLFSDEREQLSLDEYIPTVFKQDISLNNLSIILNYDIKLTDEQIDLVCNLIRESNLELSLNNKYLLDNDKVINTLIDTGNFNNLHYYIQAEKVQYFEDVIYNAYKENNTLVLSKTKLNFFNKLHTNLIRKFIKEKYFDLFVNNKEMNNYNSSKYFTELYPDIIEYLLNSTTNELMNSYLVEKIQSFQFIFIKTLTEHKQYDKVSILNFVPYDETLKNDKQVYVELIKNSFNFAVRILKGYEDSMLSIEEIREAYLTYNLPYFNEKILEFLKHASNDSLYNENLYKSVKSLLIDKYNLNENHLESMINKYGYLIIKYIENDSIIKIINLDDKKFNRMIDLFNLEPYKMNDLEAIYDSFKQEEFTLKYPNIISIFPDIMHSLESSSDISQYIYLLEEVWNDTLKNKIIYKYPEEEQLLNDNYIKYISNMLYSNDAIIKDRYTNILHIITDYYIAQKREQYRETYDIYTNACIPYEYDEKDLEKNLIVRTLQEIIIENKINNFYAVRIYKDIVEQLMKNGLSKSDAEDSMLIASKKKFISHIQNNSYFFYDSLKTKYGEELAQSIILDYKNKIDILNSNSNLKKNIGLVYRVARPYVDTYMHNSHSINDINLDNTDILDVKRKYYLEGSKTNIFELLSNIRIDLVSDNILGNDEIYDSLKRIIKKYKLDNLSPQVDSIVSDEIFDLSCSTSDISTFISFFHSIYETEKSTLEVQGKSSDNLSISIMKIFKYLDKYASVSSIYSQILGSEDEGLIRSDPKPNNSMGMTKEERLKKAVEKTFKNFNKNIVKIPTFNHNVTLSNGKLMTVIVGNFTKTTNITHGERTGACMRIGGAGSTLFDSNDIFHIEFNDPSTDKYISRVTGFRNGNTVFLNELRYSCDKDLYSDEEVVEACKIVAQELLDRSKDSECPIENVVIHRDYAMKSTKDNRVVLNISNNKKGISNFYSDVGNYVQILATNAEKGFVPVDLDNSKVPNYLPSREKIRSGSGQLIVEQINRLYTISLGLKGMNYYVDPLATTIIYGYVGEDWYVFINEQNEIVCDRIDRDERSIIEYEFAKKELQKYINTMDSEVKHAL